MTLLAALKSSVLRYLSLVIAAVGALLWVRRDAKRDAKREAALDAAEAQAEAHAKAAETLERIVNVAVLDADDARGRMLARDPGTR